MGVSDRKSRKMRGSRTHGWGGGKKHRGAGNRGGRGMAGTGKHKRTWVTAKAPNYFGGRFGRTGFVSKKPEEKIVNVSDLHKFAINGIADMSKKGKYAVLGNGELKLKLKVIAQRFSKTAEEKIKKVGGEAVKV